jgi:hypothetical protein
VSAGAPAPDSIGVVIAVLKRQAAEVVQGTLRDCFDPPAQEIVAG